MRRFVTKRGPRHHNYRAAGGANSPLRQHRPAPCASISAAVAVAAVEAVAAAAAAAAAAAGNTGVGRGKRTIEGQGWPRRGRPCKSRMPGRTPAPRPPRPNKVEQNEGRGASDNHHHRIT